jgi:hypothetical protein
VVAKREAKRRGRSLNAETIRALKAKAAAAFRRAMQGVTRAGARRGHAMTPTK